MATVTISRIGSISWTTALASGRSTTAPGGGIRRLNSSYWSFSYTRQHLSFPHIPLSRLGLSGSPCSLACLLEIGWNSLIHEEQHNRRPHGPNPSWIFASSRG